MNYYFILRNMLFDGCSEDDVKRMLGCFNAKIRSFSKGETIYRTGEHITRMGIILSGAVRYEHVDAWGTVTVIGMATEGKTIGEAYSCLPEKTSLVDFIAHEDSEIIFMDTAIIMNPCEHACACHRLVAANLSRLQALRNMGMAHRAFVTAPKKIRGKVLAFLSFQANEQGSLRFKIPFSRELLAQYLGVDRSALSAELSRMRDEGLIDYHLNEFILKVEVEDV